MTQLPAFSAMHVMLAALLAAVAVGVAAWAVARLLRARAQLRRLYEPRLAEMKLRAEAEAVLAERLERGEIDRDEHRRALLQLHGARMPASRPGPAAPAASPTPSGPTVPPTPSGPGVPSRPSAPAAPPQPSPGTRKS